VKPKRGPPMAGARNVSIRLNAARSNRLVCLVYGSRDTDTLLTLELRNAALICLTTGRDQCQQRAQYGGLLLSIMAIAIALGNLCKSHLPVIVI